MSPQYNDHQPNDIVNRIEKVALVGTGGRLGSGLARELVKTGKHVVTALSREASNAHLPEGVITGKIDYSDEASIVAALKGQQTLIITLSVLVPPGTQAKLVQAASKADVPYVMPNTWGTDPLDEQMSEKFAFGKRFGIKSRGDTGMLK